VFAEYSVKAQFVILGDFGVCGRVDPFVGGVSMMVCYKGTLIGCSRKGGSGFKEQCRTVASPNTSQSRSDVPQIAAEDTFQ